MITIDRAIIEARIAAAKCSRRIVSFAIEDDHINLSVAEAEALVEQLERMEERSQQTIRMRTVLEHNLRDLVTMNTLVEGLGFHPMTLAVREIKDVLGIDQ